MLADTLQLQFQRSPVLQRTLIKLAQGRPIRRMGKMVLVTGAPEVREVLARAEDFLPGVLYAPKLAFGACVLGADVSPRYLQERAALRTIFHDRDRIDRFAALVDRACAERIDALRKRLSGRRGRADLVTELIEPVLGAATAEFYGADAARAESRLLRADRGPATVAQWLAKIGGLLVLDLPAPFGMQRLGTALADEMRQWIMHSLHAPPPDTVLSALKALPDPPASLQRDEDLVRCVGTLMLAGATMMKASALALHQLLSQPRPIVDRAVAAACREDTGRVLEYVWEALRFHPVFPVLPRYCPRATTLATGTRFQTDVPADATVVVSPLGAMFDAREVERPDEFVVPRAPAPAAYAAHSRAARQGIYMHFADGPHRCLAEQLAAAALGALFTRLLAGLRIEPGRLRHDGPTIRSYVVELEVHEAVTHATPSDDPGTARRGPPGEAQPSA